MSAEAPFEPIRVPVDWSQVDMPAILAGLGDSGAISAKLAHVRALRHQAMNQLENDRQPDDISPTIRDPHILGRLGLF